MIRAGFCNISFARPEPAKLRPWRQFFYFCSTRRILLLDCLRSILPGRCPNWTRSGPVIDLPRILRTCCSCAALSGSWAPARRADPPADLRSWPGSSPGVQRARSGRQTLHAGHGPGRNSPALPDALTAPDGKPHTITERLRRIAYIDGLIFVQYFSMWNIHEYIAVTLFILYIDGNIYLWYSVIVEEGTQLCRRPGHGIKQARHGDPCRKSPLRV